MTFYSTIAQVIPVLLLALVWQSGYLDALKARVPSEVRFWTPERVRMWILVIAGVSVVGEATAILVLAGVVSESDVGKSLGVLAVAVLLGSLSVRVVVDVVAATKT